jgi:predicted NUDIX family phosphoesterase
MDKEQLKQKYGDEKVLCIPRWYFETAIKHYDDELALNISIANHGWYDYRYEVEMDETILQVIPYVVLRHNGKYFVTKRLAGDERLKGMVAFLGGHIDDSDLVVNHGCHTGISPYDTIVKGMVRELTEETTVKENQIHINEPIDVFVDNSSQVSRCHVCELFVIDTTTDNIVIRETEKLEGAWLTLDELKEKVALGKCEGWAARTVGYLSTLEGN